MKVLVAQSSPTLRPHGLQHVSLTCHFIHNSLRLFFYFFPLNFLFCIGVLLINDIVIVSGGQQRDLATHIHVSILSQTPLPSRLPRNTEPSSLCYTVGPFLLPILNIAVCTRPSQTS